VHVTDLARSVAFYGGLLGLRTASRFVFGSEELVFMAAGAGWIELICDSGPARSTGVLDHVALRIDDLDALLPRLQAANVRLLDEAPLRVPEIGARIVFCLGPDGERVELIERR
jgi:catechol 2,3-dioxygenase-like lactoylglutathione lyase family enzyme